jgi:hypothetical protein
MKVKFKIEKRESEFMKKQFFESVTKTLGSKATLDAESVEVEDKDEARVLELLKNTGVRYQKAA